MRKCTIVALAAALVLACFTSCSERDDSTSTPATTVTTTTTVAPSETKATESTSTTSKSEETTTETTLESDTESETVTSAPDSNPDSNTESTTVTTAETKSTTKETTKQTTASTKTTTKETTTTEKKPDPNASRVVLDVKNIQMLPELPRGSEITSTAMVLNYYGIKCDKMDLLKYLPMSKRPADHSSVWVSPDECFCGDPRETEDSFGCYAPTIVNLVQKYLSANGISGYEVQDLSGNFIDVFYPEISKGYPLIVWTTVDMQDVTDVVQWTAKNDDTVSWVIPENCVVLNGYDKDKDTFIVNDPLSGKVIEYPTATFIPAFMNMYTQAVVIRKK